MPLSTFITGADRGLGFALSQAFLELGWRVIAGKHLPYWPDLARLAAQYPGQLTLIPLDVSDDRSVRAAAQFTAQGVDCVDLLVNNAGVSSPTMRRSIQEPQDYAEMRRMYEINTLGPLRVVEAFLPLVAKSPMKRLCFVSSEAGSIRRAERTAWYGYCMS